MLAQQQSTNFRSGAEATSSAEKIAIIGAGVSGVAAAGVWKKLGYHVTIFEASNSIGGQWTQAYAGAATQVTNFQYQFGDFPWPFEADRHATRDQVVRYVQAAAEHYGIDDIRLNYYVTKMEETGSGWELYANSSDKAEAFSYVVVATGQYGWGKERVLPEFKNMQAFKGQVVTNVDSKEVFDGKKVVVLGFGKTALDLSCFSAERAAETHHVFRKARWTVPDRLLGICFSIPFFSRSGSDMTPSWVHSSGLQRFLHNQMSWAVSLFWFFMATFLRFQHELDAKLGKTPKSCLDEVMPPKAQIYKDMRSSFPVAPPSYYHGVAHGDIQAKRAEIDHFTETGVVLSTGEEIEDVDLVCACLGTKAPTFPFLPDKYRTMLERRGGPLLYRHLIHPEIPRLGFAGMNTSYLHIACCEIGSLWQAAVFRGDLELPTTKEMIASAERVSQWKQQHLDYEPQYNVSVNGRFQQHNDTLLQDLGISQWRKLPNLADEIFVPYDATDYAGVVEEHCKLSSERKAKGLVKATIPLDI